MNDLTIFQYLNMQLRVINQDGEPWFVAADLLSTLELDRKALERLDDDEKGVSSIHTLGGAQEMTIINESGLYSLILGSRKPEAKKFKKWVTSDVLPMIRKKGFYIDPNLNQPDHDHTLLNELNAALKETVQLQRQLLSIKDTELAKRTRKKQRPSAGPLTEAEIAQIRELKKTGLSGAQIAKKLNRSEATISWVCRNVMLSRSGQITGTLDLLFTPTSPTAQ